MFNRKPHEIFIQIKDEIKNTPGINKSTLAEKTHMNLLVLNRYLDALLEAKIIMTRPAKTTKAIRYYITAKGAILE